MLLKASSPLIWLLLFSFLSLSAGAATPADPDSAYKRRDFATATAGYASHITESLRKLPAGKQPTSALRDTYYNLGNAHYRLKDYPRAILAYRRALALDPSADDARYNLSLVEARLTDRFDTPQEMFFVTWFRALMQTFPAGCWHLMALSALALAFCGYWLLLRAQRTRLRKTGIALIVFGALILLISESAALTQRALSGGKDEAVVMSDTQAYELPGGGGKSLHTLLPGTTVTTTGTTYNKDWIEVTLPDGTTAWINRRGVVSVADWGKAL